MTGAREGRQHDDDARAVDAAVAVALFGYGWRRLRVLGKPLKAVVPPLPDFSAWLDLQGDEETASDWYRFTPAYTTDWNAMRDVLAALRARGWLVMLEGGT